MLSELNQFLRYVSLLLIDVCQNKVLEFKNLYLDVYKIVEYFEVMFKLFFMDVMSLFC